MGAWTDQIIPGTDICLKIGGYVRGEYFYNYGASSTNGPWLADSAKPTAIYHIQDQDNYGLLIRVHRDIVP